MTGLSVLFAFAVAISVVVAERWLGPAVSSNDEAAVEDRLFRNGFRTLLRCSAAIAVGAGVAGIWDWVPYLPQPSPMLLEEFLGAASMLAAVVGGGQMLAGLMIAHHRFRRGKHMDLGLTLRIILVLGSVTAFAVCLPLAVAWVVALSG
jgi:hypothetical protein